MTTGWDVARAAGVSQSTVSRVLRGDPKVSVTGREAVLLAAEKLNYAPDLAARALITGRSGSVAMVVPDVTNPVYPQLISAVQRELQSQGYRMLLVNALVGDINSHIATLRGGVVDGVLLATSSLDVALDQFLPSTLPTVLLIREVATGGYESYLADDAQGCELVAEHLTGLGHERIAIMTGPKNLLWAGKRVKLFRAALRRRKVPLSAEMVRHNQLEYAAAGDAVVELMDSPNPPTAIFCAADVLALGAMHALTRTGYRLPRDVSIVGFDDVTMAGWSMVGLTTIRQPLDVMARDAVSALLSQIDSGGRPASPRAHRFDVELIVRTSSGPRVIDRKARVNGRSHSTRKPAVAST